MSTPIDSDQLLLTPSNASRVLAISPRKLFSLTASRQIPVVRIGRSVRYAIDDLKAWIEAHKQPRDDR